MAVVLLLMLVQLPGYLSCLLLCAIRAAVERAVAATFAAAGDAVSAAADAAMGWRDAASSNSTAAVAFVQAAMGRPKALLAEMLAIFGLVASLSCSPATRRRRTSLLGLPRAPPRPAATFFSGAVLAIPFSLSPPLSLRMVSAGGRRTGAATELRLERRQAACGAAAGG
uniref:Uncharacterized protein n=1 Tax=Oryza sativa subsp. japonica TaxID=39947 RepID=Q69ML9_ORYSJ|nr:hypothetical protein [Oryza sativa Japonica Group]